MGVEKLWLERAAAAVHALERIYGPHSKIEGDSCGAVQIDWPEGTLGAVIIDCPAGHQFDHAAALCREFDATGSWIAPDPPAPGRRWRADGEGRCQRECEAWDNEGDHPGCRILDRLSWEVFDQPTPNKRSPCPFAVLADVLGLHRREPMPDDDRLCGTCEHGELACRWWPDGLGPSMAKDGPPWPCRHWKRRTP